MATTAYRPGAELRPLGLGELIDRTFTLYRNHFWLFCGIMVLPQGISVLISVLWTLSPEARGFQTITANPPADPMIFLSAMASRLGAASVVSIIPILMYIIAIGAVTFAVSDIYLRRPASIRVAYRQAAHRAGAVIGLSLLLGALSAVFFFAAIVIGFLGGAILGGAGGAVAGTVLGRFVGPIIGATMFFLILLAGVILAIFILVRFAVSMQIVLLEGRGVFDSLSRSGWLTAGNRWRIFLGVFITLLIVGALGAVLTMPFAAITILDALKSRVVPIWLQVGTAIASGLNGVITGPLLAITMALIYFDLRIRKEGFDIEAAMIQTQTPAIVSGEVAPPAL